MLTNKMKVYGKANDAAIVKGDKYRFTILTPRLIRIEYNENGYFEDQATQAVISRQFDVPKFSVKDTGDKITIDTGVVLIEYTKEINQHEQIEMNLNQTWYEKLGKWHKALSIYEKKL